jgi:hypothetical protein
MNENDKAGENGMTKVNATTTRKETAKDAALKGKETVARLADQLNVQIGMLSGRGPNPYGDAGYMLNRVVILALMAEKYEARQWKATLDTFAQLALVFYRWNRPWVRDTRPPEFNMEELSEEDVLDSIESVIEGLELGILR